MSEGKIVTITELAEVVAAQNAEIRDLQRQIDEQTDIIIDYELDQEEEEKVSASLASDLLDAIQDECDFSAFNEIFNCYFGGGGELE